MITYTLKMPPHVVAGEGALSALPAILTGANVRKAALFTDKGVRTAGLLEAPEARIKQAGADWVVLADVPPEPTYQQVQSLVDQCRAEGADFIVAVGGGSVMDAAKLASVLLDGSHTVRDLLDNPALAKRCCGTLMVPTTAGTGSEATPNAIVAVPEKEVKVGIVNDAMIAGHVILDGAMIKNLPRKIAAATGVDALAHAIECYTSKKATPFSDLYAMQALEMILESIETACADGGDMDAKNAMLLASFYAGVAITASGTTAVHALSYPLGGKYHIAHGVSNAMLLAPVMGFNEPACRQRLAAVYDRCIGGAETTPEGKSGAVIARLEEIVRRLDIPTSLREFGVSPDDLDGLVAAGMGVTRLLDNNMRPLTPDDARELYRQIL